jgi:hypothetical protein
MSGSEHSKVTFPWQWPTAFGGLSVTQQISSGYDAARVSAELAETERAFRLVRQDGPHHNGGWNRMGLVSPDGDPEQSYLKRGQKPGKTPVLRAMPYLESIIDELGVPVMSASVSVMLPGARVRWHRDPAYSVDRAFVRLHLPIVTHSSATLEIGHELTRWAAGILYYGDFTFPHRVAHDGPVPRIHIMIDLQAESARRLFNTEYLAAAGKRHWARRISARVFDFSERLHPAGRYAIRYRQRRQQMISNG